MQFITSGTSFTYASTNGLETMSAKSPLLSDLALMVVPGAVRELVNVTVTWNVAPKRHRLKHNGGGGGAKPPPEVDEKEKKERKWWDFAGWTRCSRKCGGGQQSQVWYCRDRIKANRIVHPRRCSKLKEPPPAARSCNTFSCDFRWVTGPWEGCSHACGTEGSQSRMVYCVRTAMVNATPEEEQLGATNDQGRRPLPQVLFDADQLTEMPTLDSWKPSYQDHTVFHK